MKRIILTGGLLAACALSGLSAFAQKGPGGLQLHGFVQASWQGNYTSHQNEFRLDEVQLEVGRQWRDAASFMLRMNYRHVDTFDAQGQSLGLDYNKFIEQAYVTVDALKKKTGMSFTLGKFRLPIGIESPNVNESYTYSRSYTLEAGTPQFGTGLMLRYQRKWVDFALYAINGWNTLTDNNDAKTFGGRIGANLMDGDLTFGVSYVAGPEPIPNRAYSNVRSPRHVVDVDAMYRWRKLTLGAEFNYSYEDRASQVNPDKRARWLSALFMANYQFTPWLSATVRYEHADDPDGSRLSLVTPQVIGAPAPRDWSGVPLTVESVTATLLFTIARGSAYGMLEWRNDFLAREEDPGLFPSTGNPTKTRRLVSASLFYTW